MSSRVVAGTALAATLATGAGLVAWAPWHPVAPSATNNDAATDRSAASVVQRLGAVPIPTPRAGSRLAPVARPRHPQLLAMGEQVEAKVPGGDVLVSALGPTQDVSIGAGRHPANAARPPKSTMGTIAVTLRPRAGQLAVRASDFTSRDQSGAAVPLRALGSASGTAAAAMTKTGTGTGTTTLLLRGRFPSGSAQLTWRHGGRVLAIWVFTVELD